MWYYFFLNKTFYAKDNLLKHIKTWLKYDLTFYDLFWIISNHNAIGWMHFYIRRQIAGHAGSGN